MLVNFALERGVGSDVNPRRPPRPFVFRVHIRAQMTNISIVFFGLGRRSVFTKVSSHRTGY